MYDDDEFAEMLAEVEPNAAQPPDPRQVRNRAKGYTFQVDDWQQVDRFLILGGGATYYAARAEMTWENASLLIALINQPGGGRQVVERAVELRNRAPKLEPILYALALVMRNGDLDGKAAVIEHLCKICWTGTQFFTFVAYTDALRGWGAAFKKAVVAWYTRRSPYSLAGQITKYPSRQKWSHRDVLRKAHLHPPSSEVEQILGYAVVQGGPDAGLKQEQSKSFLARKLTPSDNTDYEGAGLDYLAAVEQMRQLAQTGALAEALQMVVDYRLPREVLPTELLNYPQTWEALLPHMGGQALLRNLGNLSKLGLLEMGSETARAIIARLADGNWIRDQHLHPAFIINGWFQYRQGRGRLSSATWPVNSAVVAALERAYYASFGHVEPVPGVVLSAFDVSGSMTGGSILGMPALRPLDGTALMGMVRGRVQPLDSWLPMMFSDTLLPMRITGDDPLDRVMQILQNMRFGGTDARLPLEWALRKRVKVDLFEVYTDNETWIDEGATHETFNRYKQEVNPDARAVAIAFTATENSIFAPDQGLNVVGFDSGAPELISAYAKGLF